MKYDNGPLRGRIGGFHAWAWDYITFENLGIVRGPPAGQVEQVQLKYVNTELATFVGAEAVRRMGPDRLADAVRHAELRRRAATGRATATSPPSRRRRAVPARVSTACLAAPSAAWRARAEEPLPSIVPLESRLGLRLHRAADAPRWGVELAARMVDAQDRVATSLLETPTPGFTVWDVRGYWRATRAPAAARRHRELHGPDLPRASGFPFAKRISRSSNRA